MDQHTDHSTNQSAEDESIHSNSASTVLLRAFASVRSFTLSLRRTINSLPAHCICGHRISTVKSEPYSTISVVAISDSHSMHSTLQGDWPTADIFVHTGDLTQYGTTVERNYTLLLRGSAAFLSCTKSLSREITILDWTKLVPIDLLLHVALVLMQLPKKSMRLLPPCVKTISSTQKSRLSNYL